VTYTPAAAVGLAGSVTFTSNASNASLSLTLSGTGVQPPPVVHSVVLTWGASVSAGVVGYDVYRGTVSGGPYTLMTSTPVSGMSYTDASGQVGQTYYYVVTSVDSSNTQSGYSNVVSITIP
jgi:fibronectin type 3 domain-containing protein